MPPKIILPTQDLKVVHYQIGDYKDQNGNTWCNVLFEGHLNEPIRWVVKEPNAYQIGDVVYGHIEEKISQAGKPYLRFYRDKKPDEMYSHQPVQAGAVASGKYQPKDDSTQESIARSVALKASVDFHSHSATTPPEDIVLASADRFLAWLKGNSGSLGEQNLGASSPTEHAPATEVPQRPVAAAVPSGYDKFRQQGQTLRQNERDEDAEIRSLVENSEPYTEDVPY